METKKILVADDEVGIVQVIAAKLRNNGFEVITANHGDEAYILCSQQKPDFIVADYELPGLTGIELAEKVHQTPGLADVPIIVLTTKETELTQKQMTKAGIAERIDKPFSPKELLSRVENVLTSASTTME
jgi:DNA-binding response OmpR family regulator